MKINVKRSDLLRLYRVFSDIAPELNTFFLIMDPYDYVLLAKVVSSVLSNKYVVDIDLDDKTANANPYPSLIIDKDILLNVLDVMDEHATLNAGGNICIQFTNGLQILYLLETLLSGKRVDASTSKHLQLLMDQKLFSIHKKLGYANCKSENIVCIKSYLKTGDVVRVADNSGAKFVKIVSEVEPSVYIVTVIKANLEDRFKFPYGKTYCGILVRFSEQGYYHWDEVCLFEYYDGVKEPLFTSILNGTVALCTNLNINQYKTIIHSCIFKQDDCIRVDYRTSAKITEIIKLTTELEGSEFIVTLLTDLSLLPNVIYKKGEFVKGTLRKRSFNLSYYSIDVYELEISLFSN